MTNKGIPLTLKLTLLHVIDLLTSNGTGVLNPEMGQKFCAQYRHVLGKISTTMLKGTLNLGWLDQKNQLNEAEIIH